MDKFPGITFGICTYNRKNILEQSAKSLSLVNHLEYVNIRIYDDCSSEYDADYLKKLFPNAKTIKRQENNQGADKNTSIMYEDFLRYDDEWLFTADSDLIYRNDIIDILIHYVHQGYMFLSFFNCIQHKTVDTLDCLVEKDSLGAAGCLLNKKIIQMILEEIKNRNFGFDIKFCKLLKNKGIHLYATEFSYVQHIGISGYNSRNIHFDYGKSFICNSLENAEIIENTFEKYVETIDLYKQSNSWNIYDFIISIPRRIKKMVKIIKKRFI